MHVFNKVGSQLPHMILALIIFASFSLEMAEPCKKAVVYIFTSQYAILSSVLEGAINEFAERALTAGLISLPVMRTIVRCSHDQYSRCFADIVNDFTTGIMFNKSAEDILEYCRKFTKILKDLGGPVAAAGKELDAKLSTLAGM